MDNNKMNLYNLGLRSGKGYAMFALLASSVLKNNKKKEIETFFPSLSIEHLANSYATLSNKNILICDKKARVFSKNFLSLRFSLSQLVALRRFI